MDHRSVGPPDGGGRGHGDDGALERADAVMALPTAQNSRRLRREIHVRPTATTPVPAFVDNMAGHDESFLSDDLPLASPNSLPINQSYSWETHSDSEDRARGGPSSRSRDRRKFDTTTPTLIDEEDDPDQEEEEMVSLEQERLLRSDRGMITTDESSLRRTPGANMYKSNLEVPIAELRRTPGASAMHRSAPTNVMPPAQASSNTTDNSVLGFGLTLSTPVGDDERRERLKVWEGYSSSNSSLSPPREEGKATQQSARPPLAPGLRSQEAQRGSFAFAPWSQTKTSSSLDAVHGSFSPNILRLTEDIDNLLLDEDDAFAHHQGYRGDFGKILLPQPQLEGTVRDEQSMAGGNDSWTAPYVFDSESVGDVRAKVPRSAVGRNRRSRNDNGRRSRDRPSGGTEEQQQPPTDQWRHLPHAQQPKPLRNPAGTIGTEFAMPGMGGQNNMGGQRSGGQHSFGEQPNFGGQSNFGGPSNFGGQPNFGGQSSFGELPNFGERPSFGGQPNFGDRPDVGGQPGFGPPAGMAFQQGSDFRADNKDHSFSRPLSFGGAFAPPSNAGTFIRRPVPSSYGSSFESLNQGGQRSPYQMQQNQDGAAQGVGRYQSPSFQGLPPSFGSSDLSGDMGAYHHRFEAENQGSFGMGTPTGFSPTPSFGFSAIQPPYQPAAPSHDFSSMPSHLHLNRMAAPQYANQGWHQPTPMQFNPRGYFGSTNNNDWPSSEHAYGNSLPMMSDGRNMSPSPTMAPWIGANNPPHEMRSHGGPVGVGASLPASGQGFHSVSGPELPQFQMVGAPSTMFGDDRTKRDNPIRKPTPKKTGAKKGKNEKAAPVNKLEPQPLQSSPRKKVPPVKKKPQKGLTLADVTSGTITPANASVTDDGVCSICDDPSDPKRSDLIENPATRFAFKEFYRNFRSKERLSFFEAEEYAMKSLEDGSLPEKVHWRVYLEMADLAKRSNRFADARRLYQQVCQLQPYASQGWLEYSKLEEECGHLNRCTKILHAGLEYCEYSENLLTRAVKHEEKMGNLGRARELLARLKHVGIEKVWRTVLEGALLEARAGNVVMARRVLKYLMHHVPWYGPLYLEAYRLERELGRPTEALAVVERGLRAIPRYGPLWFGAFRLCEAMDLSANDFDLPKTMVLIGRAAKSISKELIWKVHLDAALMQERAAVLQAADDSENQINDLMMPCRQSFALTVLTCPPNLRWKVWLAAGRMEVAAGNPEKARALFLRAHQVVPDKGRATTILECARLEEFVGDTELAIAILCKSRFEMGGDWKVWLESVLLEIRCGNHVRAIQIAEVALESHSGTGRLWAALVQLRHAEGGEEAQYSSLEQALRAVPKSGEVWCEGGRILLNPFSKSFDLETARRHLFFATRFTPQYGDSFLETLRLELLDQWIAPIASILWETTSALVDGEGTDEYMVKCIVTALQILSDACSSESTPGTDLDERPTSDTSDVVALVRDRLDASKCCEMVDIHDLQLRCTNADPNYGLLWFHCRNGPTDTARQVLTYAKVKLSNELIENISIYVAAMIRRWSIIYSMEHESNPEHLDRSKGNQNDQDPKEWEEAVRLRLRSSPSIDEIFEEGKRVYQTGLELLESSMTGSDFITGLVELNRHQALDSMTPQEKRKALFGTDALFS